MIVELDMQSSNYRLISHLALGAAILVLGGALSGCSSGEQGREALAVREFHQRLEQGRVDLIYENSSAFLKGQLSEAQFRHFLAQTRGLGRLQGSERAHYDRTSVAGGSDLVLAFYNSRFAKASCLESFSWQVEKDGLKLAAYSCAPNMQVSCPGGVAGSKCETTPAPATPAAAAVGLATASLP